MPTRSSAVHGAYVPKPVDKKSNVSLNDNSIGLTLVLYVYQTLAPHQPTETSNEEEKSTRNNFLLTLDPSNRHALFERTEEHGDK
jgi:hypothetical protein